MINSGAGGGRARTMMSQALPDTDVFDVPDVSVIPLPIDPHTWELVNEILGYPPCSSTPITRDDGSVTRSALFPRPARSLHRLVPTAAPNQHARVVSVAVSAGKQRVRLQRLRAP